MRFIPSNYKELIEKLQPASKYAQMFNIKSIRPGSNENEQILEHIPLHDMEGEMVITQCKAIIEKAQSILSMMKPETQMEAWVQSKITLADDYISCVHDYLKHNPKGKE